MMKKRTRASAGVVAGTLAAILVATVCARLGIWQLDRRAERLARNEVIAERMALPTLSLEGGLADTDGLVYRVAEAVGEYDAAAGVVLAGRSYQGATGAHLLVPLRLADGTAIMVHRGWVPALDAAKVDPADFTPPGQVTVRGLLMAFPEIRSPGGATEPAEADAAGGEFRRLWYRMDAERWRRQSPYPLAPLYLQQLPAPAADRFPAALPEPELDEGPHLGYAIQWFSFGVIALVGWVVLLFRRQGRPRALDERTAAPR